MRRLEAGPSERGASNPPAACRPARPRALAGRLRPRGRPAARRRRATVARAAVRLARRRLEAPKGARVRDRRCARRTEPRLLGHGRSAPAAEDAVVVPLPAALWRQHSDGRHDRPLRQRRVADLPPHAQPGARCRAALLDPVARVAATRHRAPAKAGDDARPRCPPRRPRRPPQQRSTGSDHGLRRLADERADDVPPRQPADAARGAAARSSRRAPRSGRSSAPRRTPTTSPGSRGCRPASTSCR